MRAPKSIATQGNVIGAVMVNQYFCAIKKEADTQRQQGLIHIRKEDLMTDQLKGLLTTVKLRKEKVMKAMFKERCHGEMEPFKMIEHIPHIECFLWDYKSHTHKYGASSLRDNGTVQND